MAAALREWLKSNANKVMSLFHDWDFDGNGEVDKYEFRKAMRSLGLQAPVDQVRLTASVGVTSTSGVMALRVARGEWQGEGGRGRVAGGGWQGDDGTAWQTSAPEIGPHLNTLTPHPTDLNDDKSSTSSTSPPQLHSHPCPHLSHPLCRRFVMNSL